MQNYGRESSKYLKYRSLVTHPRSSLDWETGYLCSLTSLPRIMIYQLLDMEKDQTSIPFSVNIEIVDILERTLMESHCPLSKPWECMKSYPHEFYIHTARGPPSLNSKVHNLIPIYQVGIQRTFENLRFLPPACSVYYLPFPHELDTPRNRI